MYTESQMIETVDRLIKIYLESYPADESSIERFRRWMLSQYGYHND